jgi:hypothetical protein
MSYVEVRTNPNKKPADLEFYMSPSKKKRFRKKEAFKRLKREQRKSEWYSKKPPTIE